MTMLGVALARFGGLLGRRRTLGGAVGRRLTALPPALMRSRMSGILAAAGASFLLAATIVLVDGGPSAALGFLAADALTLVVLGDMIGFAFLLFGILGLVSARQGILLLPSNCRSTALCVDPFPRPAVRQRSFINSNHWAPATLALTRRTDHGSTVQHRTS